MKEKENKNKRNQERERAGGGASASAPENLTTGKKVLFSIVGFGLLPLLLLAGVELALRLAGYGHDTSFFKPRKIGGENYLVDNDKFGLRFFPPELARSPAPMAMRAEKPPSTFRIFIFGESAALGDPRPAYGAGRYLQTLLRERYPGTEFEVVCGAVTAINSHAVLPIARECARRDGDLWIIYMGNNEMIGPYGATTIFGSQSPPLWYARLSLAVQRTRLGQLLLATARKATSAGKHGPSWGGMRMFMENRIGAKDRRKEVVYQNYRSNLEDMLEVARRAGVPVILSTVAVNLKDSPPFASLSRTNLAGGDLERYQALVKGGNDAEAAGDYARAAAAYDQAAGIDDEAAELHFRLGHCLLRSGNRDRAQDHFQRACDYDALPFRTDSRLNALMREAARRAQAARAAPEVVLFDAVEWIATNNPAGIPGREVFHEHVHYNFDGNYLLARGWGEQVAGLLPESVRRGAAADWAAREICERRLALTDWNRYSVLEDMVGRFGQPPFPNQLNHARRIEEYQTAMRELRARMDHAAAEQAGEVYREALSRRPEDHRLHEAFAEFLEVRGELQAAVGEWLKIRDLIPQHHLAYFQAGRLQLRQGKLAEGRDLLGAAVKLRPDLSEGWLELGRADAAEGKNEAALANYERARQLVPRDYRVYYHIGKALSKLNRRAEAIAKFEESLKLRPAYLDARYALGEEMAFDGKVAEAQKQFEEVLRQKPDHVMAHLNLGVALVQLGRVREGISHFEEARRLDPGNPLAREYLEKVRSRPSP